jgi:hypothetical protein
LYPRNLIKSDWDINLTEVGSSLIVGVKSRFWVNQDWESVEVNGTRFSDKEGDGGIFHF